MLTSYSSTSNKRENKEMVTSSKLDFFLTGLIVPVPAGQANMAAPNPNNSGNGQSSRGVYNGRHRTRQQQPRNPRGNGDPENYPATPYLDGQYSQEAAAVPVTADNSGSSAVPKPRRGRGGFTGPSRNGYRRQPQGNHQFSGSTQRQSYTSRNDADFVSDNQQNQQSRGRFPENRVYVQQTQMGNVRENQEREPRVISRTSQARDYEGNMQQYPTSQHISNFSHYTGNSMQEIGRAHV